MIIEAVVLGLLFGGVLGLKERGNVYYARQYCERCDGTYDRRESPAHPISKEGCPCGRLTVEQRQKRQWENQQARAWIKSADIDRMAAQVEHDIATGGPTRRWMLR